MISGGVLLVEYSPSFMRAPSMELITTPIICVDVSSWNTFILAALVAGALAVSSL